MTLILNVNGEEHRVTTDPERTLLEVIREDLGLTGTKYGCGEGECRSCVVLLDGRPVSSCQTTAAKAAGKTIVTIEGLAHDGRLDFVQQAFLDMGALQCGYCLPGMILTAKALLEHNAHPSREEIVTFMNGNICRCCGYPRVVEAVEEAARRKGETATT